MKRIALEELARWSKWPERLLNPAAYAQRQRTLNDVEKEYNEDKYAKCLREFHSTGDKAGPEEIKQFEFGMSPDQLLCISRHNELYAMPLQEAREAYYKLFYDTLAPELGDARTVVELGAGYGFNLWRLKRLFPPLSFVGGEFSQNAVELAGQLYSRLPADQRVEVSRFNFYDEASYQLLEHCPGPVVLFTAHAVEQCPSAQKIVSNLMRFQAKLKTVIHFEPLGELQDDSLLGLLRRRYAQVNDYNHDLVATLRANPAIVVRSVRANVFGLNPLNATSIVQWSPAP